MKNWKIVLTAIGQVLGEVAIRLGIFQGDSLSAIASLHHGYDTDTLEYPPEEGRNGIFFWL